MSVLSPIIPTLRAFYQRADWSPEADSYVKAEGIDLVLVNAHAGILAVLPCSFDGHGYFDFDDNGEPALVIEALAEDAETVIDLVAWPLIRPDSFATALGAAPVLGWTQVTNPASWAETRASPG